MWSPNTISAPTSCLRWYAVEVKVRHEHAVAALLSMKDHQVLVPKYRVRRNWSDRIREVGVPLFPGYVFCQLVVDERLSVLQTCGVKRIVGVGKIPQPLASREVENLRILMRSGVPGTPCLYLQEGETVEVMRGPLEGVKGIVVQVKKKWRIILSVMILQRSVTVEVEHDWLRPLRTGVLGWTGAPQQIAASVS